MKKTWKWLIASFDNSPSGASARKMTAFALMICIAYLHLNFVDTANAVDFMVIDMVGVGFFLGLITADQIIQLRSGSVTTQKTTLVEQTKVEVKNPN